MTFIIFVVGLIVRIAFLFGLSRERDRVFYNHVSVKWGVKSVFFWLVPWCTESMRRQPVFTLMVFLFHLCLLATPIFLNAHNLLWDEASGISLWSMPDGWADILIITMIFSGSFLLVRRLVRPEVHILTGAWDYVLLFITLLPFITGFLAYHQWGPYNTMLLLHIISGELLLVLIPFSKLGHMLLFFFSRTFIGFEMGRRSAPSW